MTEAIKERKYIRTTITNPNGTITTARINTVTGEIKPYKYSKGIDRIRAKPLNEPVSIDYGAEGDLLDYVPYWVAMMPPITSITNGTDSSKIRKNKLNDCNIYLKDYESLDCASSDIPVLDNIFTGVSLLDCGNSRPMNKALMFCMIRDLDNINTQSVKDYTGLSEAYCRRLAQYLRVASNAFDAAINM